MKYFGSLQINSKGLLFGFVIVSFSMIANRFTFLDSKLTFLFSLLELQNAYGTLHGGSVGTLAHILSTACARTVVAEDKELFLGEISISYMSATPANVSI